MSHSRRVRSARIGDDLERRPSTISALDEAFLTTCVPELNIYPGLRELGVEKMPVEKLPNQADVLFEETCYLHTRSSPIMFGQYLFSSVRSSIVFLLWCSLPMLIK